MLQFPRKEEGERKKTQRDREKTGKKWSMGKRIERKRDRMGRYIFVCFQFVLRGFVRISSY